MAPACSCVRGAEAYGVLSFQECAIDLMMTIYKQMLPELGGYLTRGAQVDMKREEKFIRKIGSFEDVIFQKRMRLLARWGGGGGPDLWGFGGAARGRVGDDVNHDV